MALKEINLPRSEFFITTKVLSNVKDPENALKTSLRKMQIDYVDLYLIHAPFDVEIEKAWGVLETLKDQGKSPLSFSFPSETIYSPAPPPSATLLSFSEAKPSRLSPLQIFVSSPLF